MTDRPSVPETAAELHARYVAPVIRRERRRTARCLVALPLIVGVALVLGPDHPHVAIAGIVLSGIAAVLP